ncbi:MAG: ATP-binding cassette domain-containing protein [Bryobacterales bacterium]|nr:ATP-binding cassette domain-containing protein [Bryobacterales bacterium]
MIDVQNLSKRYGGFTAVDDISFRVEPGRIVGFLGPNGAGKTTTMRVLTCFLPPSRGTVKIAGFDVLETPMEVKRRVGYLPETPPLYPDMAVEGYLRFVGEIKEVPKAELEDRVERAMKRCAVLDVRGKLIAKLSKGYRQRVGLAQALLHDPEVLILDEPTSGLDPKQILETRDLIRELAGEHTIILSTHILPEVEQTCEEVVIINKGKVVATDSVENLRNRLRGGEAALVEIGFGGQTPTADTVRAVLAGAHGASNVVLREQRGGRLLFEVESAPNANLRPALAATIVGNGWELYEMKSLAYSLEEVFLQVTRGDSAETDEALLEAPAEDLDAGAEGDNTEPEVQA